MLSRLCTLTPLRVTALGSVSDPITVLSDPITVLSELRPHYKDSEHKLGLPKVRIQNTVRNSVDSTATGTSNLVFVAEQSGPDYSCSDESNTALSSNHPSNPLDCPYSPLVHVKGRVVLYVPCLLPSVALRRLAKGRAVQVERQVVLIPKPLVGALKGELEPLQEQGHRNHDLSEAESCACVGEGEGGGEDAGEGEAESCAYIG